MVVGTIIAAALIIVIGLSAIPIIFGILIFCIVDVLNSLKNKDAKEIKILNEIANYNYTLNFFQKNLALRS